MDHSALSASTPSPLCTLALSACSRYHFSEHLQFVQNLLSRFAPEIALNNISDSISSGAGSQLQLSTSTKRIDSQLKK